MTACAVSDLFRFRILFHYGYSSKEYFYFYYYSDALLTIVLYLALISLFVHVFKEMNADKYLIFGASFLLFATALFSYLVVAQSKVLHLSSFAVELSQNLYFVGLVLTFVLWGAILKLRETRARLVQIVLSLGIYFSLFAANYAVCNLYSSSTWLSAALSQLFGCLLPLAWAYAFWRTPEESRLVPARLAVSHR